MILLNYLKQTQLGPYTMCLLFLKQAYIVFKLQPNFNRLDRYAVCHLKAYYSVITINYTVITI